MCLFQSLSSQKAHIAYIVQTGITFLFALAWVYEYIRGKPHSSNSHTQLITRWSGSLLDLLLNVRLHYNSVKRTLRRNISSQRAGHQFSSTRQCETKRSLTCHSLSRSAIIMPVQHFIPWRKFLISPHHKPHFEGQGYNSGIVLSGTYLFNLGTILH